MTTYYLQSEEEKPFIAIVLYIDEKYDPKDLPFSCFPPNQLIQVHLVDSLKKARHLHKALMVLEPLVLESREELAEKIPQWKATPETLDSPESEKRHLRESLLSKLKQLFAKAAYFECASLLEMMRSESHAFRSWDGRIAQYFQGLTQRRARIKSRMRQALATEELR